MGKVGAGITLERDVSAGSATAWACSRRAISCSTAAGGAGGPRNAGVVAAATAPFVAYFDHDDRWLPTHLAILLGLLKGGAALAVTGCVRIDEAGRELGRSGLTDLIWHPELQTTNAMFEPSRVGHARALLAEVGG